jgi:3-hydroxyisobutyrate dehydrogenase-like beta-hydroxyacid dehydrogenase
LSILGPEHRFTTKVVSSPDGVILVGGGDPYLGYASDFGQDQGTIQQLADLTVAALGSETTVTLGYDESLFAGTQWNTTWDEGYRDDVTPISALWLDGGWTEGYHEQAPADHAAQVFSAALTERGVTVTSVTSTKAPDEAKELAALCADKEVGFLDCGVTPGSLAPKNGLVAMVGGDESVLEQARPVLADWAGSIVHCGTVGTGMVAKVARNVNTFGFWRIVTESTRLAMAAGIKPQAFYDLLVEADKVENIFYNMLRHKAQVPDGKLPANMGEMYPKFMFKDLHASKELSEAFGVEMPVRDAVYDLIDDTCDL